MTIIARISQLFRADIHSLLDQVEEPALVLRQAIREMEEEVAKDYQAKAQYERNIRDLDAKSIESKAAIDESQTKIELCVRSNQEDLARSMIATKLAQEKTYKRLLEEKQKAERLLNEINMGLEVKTNKLKGIKDKAEFAQSVSSAPSCMPTQQDISAEEIEVVLLAERQRLAGL